MRINNKADINALEMKIYRGAYIILNYDRGSYGEYENYLRNGVPVAKILVKLFEQKGWDIRKTPEVSSDLEIREFEKGSISTKRLK